MPKKDRTRFLTAVFGIFFRNDHEVLLLRRYQTGYEDGKYSLPAGHVEGNESLRKALIREMKEELGVEINQEDLEFSFLMHRNADDGERLDVYFLVTDWGNEPKNMEPSKADDLAWFPVEQLPENIVPFVGTAIKKVLAGENYAEYSWKT